MALNVEIDDLDDTDREEAEARSEGWMESQLPARCWEVLERKVGEGSEREVKRMQLVKKLRAQMAEYQDALIRQSRVLAFDAPSARAREALTGWFKQYRPLVGHSYNLIESERDLVALRTPPDTDRLTSLLQQNLGYYLRTRDTEGTAAWNTEITYFPESTVRHIVSIISVMLAAILLVGAIVALYFAHSREAKLGLIAVFTTAFAASVGLLTNARKAEIYASTAAYAAVLVVYVSNDPAK